MFEVVRVKNAILTKTVLLKAQEDMSEQRQLLAQGGHSFGVMALNYNFEKGTFLSLRYAFWKRFQVGDLIPLSQVIAHPSAPKTRVVTRV